MTTTRQLKAWIRLSCCRSVGPRTWNRWLAELARQDLSLGGFFDLPAYRRDECLRNWPTIARALRREAPSAERVKQIAERLDREKTRLVSITDSVYPRRLLSDLGFDAPTFLYVTGKLTHLRSATVAIVGTREPSDAGRETARAYAAALAREGIHVVSGHARGIDIAAHEGALRAGGSTSLVLPRGLFAFSHAPALRDLATPDNCLILSEFAPHITGGRELPIRRNTTIASLADGLIVIECGLIGGTSYTFREARRLRRPLWSVIYPEPVPPSAAGNHSLLSAGAKALEPGETGAQRCCPDLVQTLRASHAKRPRSAAWPPVESPGQAELF